MPYRVLIVDDQAIARQVFRGIVEASPAYALTDAIASAKVADAYCAAGLVDLILMDVMMKDGYTGLDASARIKASYPQVKIIIVTTMPDALFLKRAREVGVDSFWHKEVQAVPLLELMDRTMAGERIYPDWAPTASLGIAKSSELTEREIDVLHLLADGLTDKEIAQTLFLSVTTVRFHINNLLSKTGFTSRTELAISAVSTGVALPGIWNGQP